MKKILLLFILIAGSTCAQVPLFKATIYDSSAVKGYFFLVSNGHLLILDKHGDVVYYNDIKTLDTDFKLQPGGMMSYFSGDKFLLMDSTFTIIDSVRCKNYETDFHELKILSNGHIFLLGHENVKMYLSKYRWRGEGGSDTSLVSSAVIQELDAKRNVVFEWHAGDHYAFDDVDTSRYPSSDSWWVHWNSLDLDKDGNILVSSRNFSEITKINHKSGSIIWRLGGKRNQFKFINCPIPFYGQRNIRALPDGNITFLDGGNAVKPHGARAMEFKLDEKKKTATLKWSYAYASSFTTIAWGNVQRLSHSNTLIDFGGLTGSSALCFVIVNSSGKKLFQLNGSQAFRVYQYDQLPFKLHRPAINCIDSLGVKYLDAGTGYDSYIWSTGDSTQRIKLTGPGDYSVFVPYGDEGYISSEKVMVKDIENPCASLPSVKQKNKKKK